MSRAQLAEEAQSIILVSGGYVGFRVLFYFPNKKLTVTNILLIKWCNNILHHGDTIVLRCSARVRTNRDLLTYPDALTLPALNRKDEMGSVSGSNKI